jgi:MFS family permease
MAVCCRLPHFTKSPFRCLTYQEFANPQLMDTITTTTTISRQQTDLRNLIAACSAIGVFGLAFGMTAPLLSLLLEQQQVSAELIGLNSAMMPLGILLFAPVIPYLSARMGPRRLAIIASLITCLLFLCYKIFDNLAAWFVIRTLHGMSISILFVLSEAWIIGSVVDEHRGKVVAIYASVLSISFAAGPALVGIIGINGWQPFIVGGLSLLLGTLVISTIREDTSTAENKPRAVGWMAFIPKAPMLILAVGCFAILDSASLSMLPVYGVGNGMSQSDAAFALTALIIGNVVLQFPIGWLSDIYPPRIVLAGCALLTAVLIFPIPWLLHSPWLWPVLILAGSTGYGVYTVSLKSLGDRFSGQELINGTAAFSAMWGVGALGGSVAGGWSIEISTLYGMPFMLAGVYVLLLIGLLLRRGFTTR